MLKAFATALTLATALSVGAIAAPAYATPKAKAARASVKHSCKVRRGKAARRCLVVKRPRAHNALDAAGSTALQASNITAYGFQVSWPGATGTAATNIYVNGQLLDQITANPADSYQIQGLWPATSFTVTIELYNASGQSLVGYTRSISTAPRTSAFPRLFAANAFINTPIGGSPSIAPDSSAIVAQAIASNVSDANLANDDDWGIPIVTAEPQSDAYDVGCGFDGCPNFGKLQIPAGAQPNHGSDSHLVVLQPNDTELDMWAAQHTTTGWAAGNRWVVSDSGPATDCGPSATCGGADAAEFALAAGVVRPEEIAQGHIDHALAITTPDTRQGYIACPATYTDGTHADPNALPMGAHLQLNPSINVAKLQIPSWQKVIAVALQQYGAYVTDTGGSLSIRAQSNLGLGYDAWAKAGVPASAPSLSDLPWNAMRVLSMTQC